MDYKLGLTTDSVLSQPFRKSNEFDAEKMILQLNNQIQILEKQQGYLQVEVTRLRTLDSVSKNLSNIDDKIKSIVGSLDLLTARVSAFQEIQNSQLQAAAQPSDMNYPKTSQLPTPIIVSYVSTQTRQDPDKRNVTQNISSYVCYSCNSKFQSKETLEVHIQAVHIQGCSPLQTDSTNQDESELVVFMENDAEGKFDCKEELKPGIFQVNDDEDNGSQTESEQDIETGEESEPSITTKSKILLAEEDYLRLCNVKLQRIDHTNSNLLQPSTSSDGQVSRESKRISLPSRKYHDKFKKTITSDLRTISKCLICAQTFVKKRELNNHMRIAHTTQITPEQRSKSLFKCSTYNANRRMKMIHKQVSTMRAAAADTIQVHHMENTKVFHCTECDRTFGKNVALKSHMKCHRKEIFYCTECDRKFRAKAFLMTHIRRHRKTQMAEPQVYQCAECNRKFKTRKALVVHLGYHRKNAYKESVPLLSVSCDREIKSEENLEEQITTVKVENKTKAPMEESEKDQNSKSEKACTSTESKEICGEVLDLSLKTMNMDLEIQSDTPHDLLCD